MAVYTQIDARGFRDILTHYMLGKFVSADPISEGVENSNYLLHTEQGRYIFTVFEKRVDAGDLPFFLSLMAHLSSRNLPVPQPVSTQEGALEFSLPVGKMAAIFTFLSGKSPRRISTTQCEAVGGMLALIHRATAAFSSTRPNSLTLHHWHEMLDGLSLRMGEIDARLADEVQEHLNTIQREWPHEGTLPTGVIHADLFPDNVLFTGDDITGVLDFYFACTDFYTYDLAITLNAWCFEHAHEFNVTRARAMIRGYQKVRPLSEEEVAFLPVLAQGAAMRFLLSRVHDWLYREEGALVTPKNPIEYLDRLRFHMQVRDAGEYGI